MAYRTMHEEPWRSMIERIDALTSDIYRLTGRLGITRISVTSDLGLQLGIPPGTTAYISVSCGQIAIYCEDGLRSANG